MGEGSWTWDGTDQDGNPAPEGDYTFKITGTNVDGESVDIQEYIVGVIDEMDYSTGNPQPSIDGIRIDIGDILEVVGWRGRAPLLRFVRRAGDVLNITGEKVTGDQIVAAARDALRAVGAAIGAGGVVARLADAVAALVR